MVHLTKTYIMRLFLSLSILLSSFYSIAQNGPISFEPGEYGLTWTWTVFENIGNPPLEIVGNPDQTGINTSSRAAKFTALQGGAPYAGVESAHALDLGTFTLNPNNCIVKIMVFKPVISNVGIKFATAAGASTGELLVANTLINQWEELTFDFTPILGLPSSSGIDQLIIFPDFQNRSSTNICYFDNITFGVQGPPLATPMVPAPNPTFDPIDVISMFSNVYTNVPVDTWQTGWSQGSLSDIQIQGNDTKKYSALNFVGIETTGSNLIDLSNMTHLYLDVWTANMTEFRVKLVDFGFNLAYGGGDDSEHEIAFTPTLENWVNLDIPLTNFTNLSYINHIAQLILSGNPVGNGIVYVDNVLFHNVVTGVNDHVLDKLRIYPNPVQGSLYLQHNEEITDLKIYALTGSVVKEFRSTQQNEFNVSDLMSGAYICEVTTVSGQSIQQKFIKE
jgi:hypothetical protein